MGNVTYQHSLAKGRLLSKIVWLPQGDGLSPSAHSGDVSCGAEAPACSNVGLLMFRAQNGMKL